MTYAFEFILVTVIICASVKRFCKSFLRRNGLQNRFTAAFRSSVYNGGQYIFPINWRLLASISG